MYILAKQKNSTLKILINARIQFFFGEKKIVQLAVSS